MRKIIDPRRYHVSEDRLKTIGIKPAVWRELRKIATDHEITLSEAIELLLQRSGAKDGNATGSDVKKPTDRTD